MDGRCDSQNLSYIYAALSTIQWGGGVVCGTPKLVQQMFKLSSSLIPGMIRCRLVPAAVLQTCKRVLPEQQEQGTDRGHHDIKNTDCALPSTWLLSVAWGKIDRPLL